MHIIGRGRYAREVYPERSAALSVGLRQVGYDQATDTMTVPPGVGAFFPRNIAGDPLKVVLPGVIPGNALEVDWRLNLGEDTSEFPSEFLFQVIAMVTFDGSAPALPSATTFFVVDSWGSTQFYQQGQVEPDDQSLSALAAVLIPTGATIATVELLYLSDGGAVIVGGTTNKQLDTLGLSATLKVSEINIAIVSQLGPGNLSPGT